MSNELEKTAQATDMKLDVDVRLIEPRGNLMGFANVTGWPPGSGIIRRAALP